jgi:serine protease Do
MLTETGLAVTNAHVVSGTWDLVAKLYDGKRASVQPVRIDHELDLALIRIPDRVGLRHVRFGSSAGLKIGETVFTVGSPLSDELSFTVTRGVVSSAGRLIAGRNFVQHDAAINPGCSGGPLLNSRGLLIGINTWKISQMQGLGFAIPVEDVKFFFERSSP